MIKYLQDLTKDFNKNPRTWELEIKIKKPIGQKLYSMYKPHVDIKNKQILGETYSTNMLSLVSILSNTRV